MNLQANIESAISEVTNQTAIIADSQSSFGGCINDSRIISLVDGRQFFIKTNPAIAHLPNFFQSEFDALTLLAQTNTLHIPAPVTVKDEFIVLEIFSQGKPANDWQQQMGYGLAQLHKQTRQQQFGLSNNNYLGTSIQINDWQDDWLTFFRDQRLAYQLNLFKQQCTVDDVLLKTAYELLDKLEDIIGDVDEPAVLLHGDLWSGNVAANERGEPVIFDPASYYGHREAEFGMMRLFGGFDSECEAAYQEVWPFEVESERRIGLYRLYHELNHLNLFGPSYYSTCLSTMRTLI